MRTASVGLSKAPVAYEMRRHNFNLLLLIVSNYLFAWTLSPATSLDLILESSCNNSGTRDMHVKVRHPTSFRRKASFSG